MARRLAYIIVALAVLGACRETTLVPPRSLNGPTKIVVSRGDVCLTTFETENRVVDFVIEPCEPGEEGAIGLVINERSDRLALLDLSLAIPRLVDLDPTAPGPSHLHVGRLPVDLAVSPDGTAAYTLNQLDQDVSIVDLSVPEVLAERYHVDDTPIALEVEPASGEVVVAAGSPSTLWAFPGATECDEGSSGFDCSVAARDEAPRTLGLPGTVSNFVFHPGGDEAWVVYRDLPYASVVSFAPTPEGFDTPCLNGIDEKPCITAQVALTYGCADGLDNDGDGAVDQGDPQCWSPLSAESPLGIGRRPTDVCANGQDDDGDGLVDREDPECMAASGMSEEIPIFDELPLAVCTDGLDNDGDGAVDYPNDDACYGSLGRTEQDVRPLGFDGVGIDTHGVFVYVIDRANEQILVVDGVRKRLIDAPAAKIPETDAFDVELGVDVIPSPLSIQGVIDRTIVYRDANDDAHGIVRHDYGAWVSSNDGSLQYVETLVAFCEVDGEELVTRDEFWAREQGPLETRCLSIPEIPLEDGTARAVAADPTLPAECLTDEFLACAECLEAQTEGGCEACAAFSSTQFDLCRRAYVDEDVTVYYNPRFSLLDSGGEQARVLGSGTCEQPDALAERLSGFAAENPSAPQELGCTSLLAPQPLHPTAATLSTTNVGELDELPRADVVGLRTLSFDTADGLAPFVTIRPHDELAVDEAITVTYEGTLPGSTRSDGVLPVDTDEEGNVWIDIGFNACAVGVREGDRLVITQEPDEDCDLGGTPEYEIIEVRASELLIAPVPDGDGLATAAPIRSCFDTAVAYEVRPVGEWVVSGDVLGLLSSQDEVFGRCLDRYEAERIDSRVDSAELFEGPYYSFYLFPGYAPDEIAPVRGTSYTFQISSGFVPLQYPTCSSVGQQCAAGLFPTDVTWVPGLPSGSLLLSPDPNDNFVHVRNLDDAAAGFTVIR